ncbi:MAG: hypothetical protein J6X43_11395, partial [Bacteroidales bacterium]|nr:hypothetical protein [Bacteroidales bacterium]
MKRYLLLILILLFSIHSFCQNQTIQLKSGKNEGVLSIEDKAYSGFDISLNIQQIKTKSLFIDKKRFIQLDIEGLSEIFEAGVPNIPVFS